LECAARLHIFGLKVYMLGDDKLWNWFDVFCIFLGMLDVFLPLVIENMSALGSAMLLKMLRLMKLGRLVRALQYPIFGELLFMINGVACGLRVLLWALVLLSLIVYFVAVILVNLMADRYDELNSVPTAMFTIFRCLTDGCAAYDGTPFQERVRADFGVIFVVPYIITNMIVLFGLFNLIMAVFVDKVGDNSARKRQEQLGASAEVTRTRIECCFARFMMRCKSASGRKHHLLTYKEKEAIAAQFEADELAAFRALPPGLEINRKIFNEWLQDAGTVAVLNDSDVDTSDLPEMYNALDSDMDGLLSSTEIVDGLMTLRGPISKIDMIAIRLKTRYCTQILHDRSSRQ